MPTVVSWAGWKWVKPNVGKSLAKTIATYYNYDFNKFYTEGIQEKIDYNNITDLLDNEEFMTEFKQYLCD